jgi:hypothetical protein
MTSLYIHVRYRAGVLTVFVSSVNSPEQYEAKTAGGCWFTDEYREQSFIPIIDKRSH